MHELGDWFKMTLNPDTPEEVVLLDIPNWSFDWQLNYSPIETVVITEGDTVRVECGWDANRRKPELEPRWVMWGEGTDDEMCIANIVTRPSPG